MATASDLVEQPTELKERLALRAWQSGDAQAFGEIVRQYMRRAYFTALGLVGNHEDALDLSQEAFVRAFRAREQFDVRQKFFTWYYRILRNLCLNHLRRSWRETSVEGGEGETASDRLERALGVEEADPAVLAERNELSERLWKAIGCLRALDREVLVLREVEGCSYAEISKRLDIPPGTVMSRLFYARQRLKQVWEASL